MMDTPVLDPCCGARMMWFKPQDQRCLFGDMRDESITVTDRTHREVAEAVDMGQRVLERIEARMAAEARA